MKIYAVSDMHGNLDGLDPAGYDVVVVAGDFALLDGFGKWRVYEQKKWVQDEFFKWICRYPDVQFVVVPGNHDMFADPNYQAAYRDMNFSMSWPLNAKFLVNSGCEIGGVRFWGTPNVPIINYRWAFESDPNILCRCFSEIPENTDVLVSHAPPHIPGAFVDVSLEYGTDSPAYGSRELADAVLEKKPRYLFCGHIHSGCHGRTAFGDTAVYNVSRVNESYEIAYEPTTLEIL